MESSIREETVLNRENERRIKKTTRRKRSLVRERMQSQKETQDAAFNRTRGILNLRRVLDGFVKVENEKSFKRGSSLQEEKIHSRPSSWQKVVQRTETSPLLHVPLLTPFNKSQDAAMTSWDNQGNVKPFDGKRNKEPENIKWVFDVKQTALPSVSNEPENLKRDFERKEDPLLINSSKTTPPPMNVLLEVPRPPSRASWHSPSSIEFSRVSGESPSSDVEDTLNLQPKEIIRDKPTHVFPSRGRLPEKIIPSRVLHESKSCDISRVQPFEELISKDKKRKLGEYYSHPLFNVVGKRISCERSVKKQFSSNKDNIDSIVMAVKQEWHQNKNVNIRSKKSKHSSKKILRRLLCCSRRQLSSSSSTNSDFTEKLSRSRNAYTLKNSVVGTNTSRSYISSKATQTLFSYSGNLFPQGKKQDVKKSFFIPKCDQSTATEEEAIGFQETEEKTVIPVHVKCSTTLSLKNKVDGQTRTIKFSDNEIIIEVSGNNTDEISPKVERLVIEPSREYEKAALPQYLETNRTQSTKDISIRTSKMDIPYVASIPAWIWNETSMILTKNKRDRTLIKLNDRNCNEVLNEPSTKISGLAAPVIVTEEDEFRGNVGLEQQEAETENKLISCFIVDVINNPSSNKNNNPIRNDTVSGINKLKTKERKDAVTQTTFKFSEGINVFCQTTNCPQPTDSGDPERELLYVDYEGQRVAEKSLNDPHRFSQSGTRKDSANIANDPNTSAQPVIVSISNGPDTSGEPVIVNISNDPDTSAEPVIVNISNDPDTSAEPVIVNISYTTSAFKAAAYDHEIEQLKYLERASSLLSSGQRTVEGILPGSINLNETRPDKINVSESPDKGKMTDERRSKSQLVQGKPLAEQERISSKLDRQSNVQEADAHQEEVLPHVITTSRPFLRLSESDLGQDPWSTAANREESGNIDEKQKSLGSPGGRKSINTASNSESSAKKSKDLDKTLIPQQKHRQHYQTGRDSLSRGETEMDRKSTIQNSKNRDKTNAFDVTEKNRSSQLKTTEFLSQKPTPSQHDNVKERLKNRSLLSEPQRMPPIDNSKKASVAFKSSESPKERKNLEKANLETIQSSSQSSFIKPSNTSILFVVNDPKLAFQGKGKRDRFAARAGVRAPPQHGRPRGPPPPRSYNFAADPNANRGRPPGKGPVVPGSPSGSFDDPGHLKAKKGKQHEKVPVIIRSPSDEPVIYPNMVHDKLQAPIQHPKTKLPIQHRKTKVPDEEEEEEETEITPFPTTMLRTDSTSSSIASSTGLNSESISSVVSGASIISKSSVVSEDSSDAESTRSPSERKSQSSRRSHRSSARASEPRASATPEARHSTIDEGAISPAHGRPSSRVSEQRGTFRGSKYLPDMILSDVDEALKSPKKTDVSSPRESDIRLDKERHSVASKKSREEVSPPPRSSLRDSDFLPSMILSTTDDAMQSPKQQDRSSSRMSASSRASKGVRDGDSGDLPKSRSTSEEARSSSRMRDGTKPSLHHSLIRRSDFFPDAGLPTIYGASKSPSADTYSRKSDRALSSARYTSGEQYLREDTQVKRSGRSRESSTYSSKKSLYDSRSHSINKDEDTGQFERIRSIEIAKALEHKYSLPDSDESSEIFRDTVISGSRELPDSSVVEPSGTESDKLKEWDSSDLPTTVREVDTIPYESDSKGFTQVEDLGDISKEPESTTMIVHRPPKPLPCARHQLCVPYVKQDKQDPYFVDAKIIPKQERRHVHKESCQPLPRAEKSALNNMCEMFCNIFPCCRKFSDCCKRKSAYNRKTTPSQPAKKREGKSSKSSITSSQLCGKCDRCESATMPFQGAPILRQSNPPGPPEITVGYNFTNLYGVYMLALEQSNNSGCVGVQNFSENMFSTAIYPRVYDNSSSTCIFSDLQIKNKSKDSKMGSSELSSTLSSNICYSFKHTPNSHATAMNDTTCKEHVSEDSQKSVFTTTTPFSLSGTTSTPSDSNEFSFKSHERDFNSPPTTSCLFDLFSYSNKKLVLSEFYRKNYRKEKSLVTHAKRKFRKKISSHVIDMNFQSMKPKNIKKGNVFEEYTTNSGCNFLNNKNKENTTPHSLIQKWSDRYQQLVDKTDDSGLDVTHTRNELFEDFTEGERSKRCTQTVNYDPHYDEIEEHLKIKKKELVRRLKNRNELSPQAIDCVDTKNITTDLKTNLKNLYKNICKKSKNEIQYRKTKKIKEEMFKIHI